MLELSVIRDDNGYEINLQLPTLPDTITLDAIRSKDISTCIKSVNSPAKALNDILLGMMVDEQELNELVFLSRKLGGMEQWEFDKLNATVQLEKPESIKDIVNLSCNLYKFDLLPGITNEEALGQHLLNERRTTLPESIGNCMRYDLVASGYLADHPGVLTDSGFVLRKDEPLDMVYDGEKLPEPYCDSNGIFSVRLNPKGKPNRVTLTFPASDERITAALNELGVSDLEDCYAICTSSIPDLLDHLPNYDGLECLNLASFYFGTNQERNKLIMAVLEAEVPGSMYELPALLDEIEEYRLLPESIKTPEDYVHYILEDNDGFFVDGFTAKFVDFNALGKALMEEHGVVQTSFGLLNRADGQSICQLPEELSSLRLFSPLYPKLYTSNNYGYLEDEPEEMSTYELCDYKKQILRTIKQYHIDSEGERGLANYLRNTLLNRKVYSMIPTVEEWDGRLWGVLEVQTRGELSEGEMQELTEEWSGQCSDGWGEGFEQQSIEIDQGELNVSFWGSSQDFVILPEQELKGQEQARPGFQISGMS